MSDLLTMAVAAHGGLDRWQRIGWIKARASIGGPLWQLKGKAGMLADVEIKVDPHRQHLEYSPFGGPGRHSVYEPDHTAIIDADGAILDFRSAPRMSFAGHGLTTPWDDQHLIYFSGYAMWTYLTTPFLFNLPGFESEEVDPWDENGETWRRLRVAFPPDVHSHSTVQTFYFDSTGILKRHDYSADVLGGTTSANYALAPKTFDGIVYPTQRRIYPIGPDNRPIVERLAITIDFHAFDLTRREQGQ